MERRQFLKNSIGALLFGVINTNKVLASVAKDLTPTSPNVLLYLIQNKKGQWKVRGTKWVDVAKKRVDPNKVLIETFKPLEIVSNDVANKRKNELWIEYGCSGEKGAPLDVIESTNRVKDNHIKSEKLKTYMSSEKRKENWKKTLIAGGKSWGKILGQKNKESGWMNKIRPEGQLNYFNTIPKEQRTLNGIKGGKAASIINLQSGQVMMAQKLAAASQRKQVINIETNEVYNSAREVSNIMNYNYGTFKNKLSGNSGRKNNTPFRYKEI